LRKNTGWMRSIEFDRTPSLFSINADFIKLAVGEAY